MAETLGALCDKLTVIKLKQWHATDPAAQESLAKQEAQLQQEICDFVTAAVTGQIPAERLTFASNKVYKKENNIVADVLGGVGEVFSRLAAVNCMLWHEQEKVYEFEQVAPEEKDKVVKQLAVLNLERNKCIDAIDKNLQQAVVRKDPDQS